MSDDRIVFDSQTRIDHTADQKREWQRAAATKRMKLAQWIRESLDEVAERQNQKKGQSNERSD